MLTGSGHGTRAHPQLPWWGLAPRGKVSAAWHRKSSGGAARVYASGTERHKTRVLLCHVYHHALHGHYQVARDQLLTSHLADTIHQFDISTQILYNRAIVRCGICAFDKELLPEAHSALMEIAAGSRLKELLAQPLP